MTDIEHAKGSEILAAARDELDVLGRFINRDPIGEAGGLNLCGFCSNDGINGIAPLGLTMVGRWWDSFTTWAGEKWTSFSNWSSNSWNTFTTRTMIGVESEAPPQQSA